ncbi:alpha/beta fold hydrolase [Streptomyces boncukensis]|uniref:Alpha/beta hydrolase n=1 Tax=Streptomyces boncukensis TaxID=2711219 RepID=A0A6G4X7B6_9ACTN|nr:alpha/beta hydrolase [Streptomyces boncukensis]NGO73032.1 alpha/beta hydrolase [Streptomyces boncukensis]
MVRRINVTGADGIRLAAWEFADPPKGTQEGAPDAADTAGAADTADSPAGRTPPGVLLLHGLMGRASHWAQAARWLSARYRAIALDQRGHGRSDKPAEGPYDREAYVADAEAAIEQLGLAPVALVGHSMGALTAWQLAAKRPDLVQALVICDMRASALGEQSQSEWESWFKSWPVPFATLGDVRRWFGEDDPLLERTNPSRGEFFVEVMAERADGWRPVFSPRQMLRARETWVHDAHWDELAQVRCPTLVVRGIDGELGRAEAQEMVRVLPRGIYAEVPDAGHLVHYDQPDDWRRVIEPFLQAALPSGG